ncbi:hypothetical protein EV182_004300, partial [Spiromyces aspiralis]
MVPWRDRLRLLYLRESHTSVVGLRNVARSRGGCSRGVTFEEVEEGHAFDSDGAAASGGLFAYPGQCNLSGARYPIDLAGRIKRRYGDKWLVLLDAAALVPTTRLDLDDKGHDSDGPDFIVMSFYKVFGAPTGLGALFVKKAVVGDLDEKIYFGGGTVAAIAYDSEWQRYRDSISMRYEDGTPNYQAILSLEHAMNAFERNFGSLHSVSRHVQAISEYAYKRLVRLVHTNGRPMVRLYVESNGGQAIRQGKQGGTFAFNVMDARGQWVGYVELERLASLRGIALRVGGHCNPGCKQRWLEMDASDAQRIFDKGHVCWDDHDIVDGRPVGMVRISFGAMSSVQDVDSFVQFLQEYFANYTAKRDCAATATMDNRPSLVSPSITPNDWQAVGELTAMAIYPIKSCHSISITAGNSSSWPLAAAGFAFDRAWMLVRQSDHSPMTQKKYPEMAKILPRVDLARQALVVRHATNPDCGELVVPFYSLNTVPVDRVRVCGDVVTIDRSSSDEVSRWLSNVLGVSCYLAFDKSLLSPNPPLSHPPSPPPESHALDAKSGDSGDADKGDAAESRLCTRRKQANSLHSFANDGQYLLVNEASARQVADWVHEACPDGIDGSGKPLPNLGPLQYRPNIVVRGRRPFEEFNWEVIEIGSERFRVMGPCRRCQIMCNDQHTGIGSREPYLTLAKRCRLDGKVVFGLHLKHLPSSDRRYRASGAHLRLGDIVTVL